MNPCCGTAAGYQRHFKQKTYPCEPCLAANAAASREWRRRQGPRGTGTAGQYAREKMIEQTVTIEEFEVMRGYDRLTRTYAA